MNLNIFTSCLTRVEGRSKTIFITISLPPPHFMKLLGKTFKCKMKIMSENQMRKLEWTQTIIIILLIQAEQIPTSEQNDQWMCKLKKSLNQRRVVSLNQNLFILCCIYKSLLQNKKFEQNIPFGIHFRTFFLIENKSVPKVPEVM